MKMKKLGSRYALALVCVTAACGGSDNKADPGAAAASSNNPTDARMTEGLDLLYKRNDPYAAEQAFRDVLKANPSHYGAHFQLAKAIDREGKPAEARPLYEEMLKSAQAINDTATISLVQARLAQPDTVGAEGLMATGLHDLYTVNDPAGAAEQFKKVLAKNPTHYGATYQLAAALDKAGKSAEARPYWEKTLAMAKTYNDTATIATAQAKLK
jgi:Tfp pilus assembly protein PilF